MRFILSVLLLLFVAACSGGGSGPAVIRDRDPVDFEGRSPLSYPVRGIDVSRFQTSVNWRRAADAGVRFAFIKATEGGDWLDPKFKDHWRGAGRAGIRRGAYHFYYFCTPPAEQAAWFIRNVPSFDGALPPVLDMEWNHLSRTCRRRPSGDVVRAEMRVFLRLLESHYGQRPIIYTTPDFYADAGLAQMRREEFWLRSTKYALRRVYPGQRWSFWQYSMTGQLPSTSGNIDLNVFNGSEGAWSSWVARRRQ